MLFISRSSGPLRFCGYTTKYQLNHVSAVTTLCLHIDTGFLGRKLERSKYDINVYQSTCENKILDSFLLKIPSGKLSNGTETVKKVENLVNAVAQVPKPTHLPPQNQAAADSAILPPDGLHGMASTWKTWKTQARCPAPNVPRSRPTT